MAKFEVCSKVVFVACRVDFYRVYFSDLWIEERESIFHEELDVAFP